MSKHKLEISLQNVIPAVFDNDPAISHNSNVWGQNITFHHNNRYLIEAASGTGKTSFCTFLLGMRTDYNGKIFFNGRCIKDFNSGKWTELRQMLIGWLPQEIGLFQSLTLWENLLIKNRITNFFTNNELISLVERIGLSDKLNIKARHLSLGQQQRVAFLRMLCQPADFFILDEPISHLDKDNCKIITDILEERYISTGCGIIITSVGIKPDIPNLITYTL